MRILHEWEPQSPTYQASCHPYLAVVAQSLSRTKYCSLVEIIKLAIVYEARLSLDLILKFILCSCLLHLFLLFVAEQLLLAVINLNKSHFNFWQVCILKITFRSVGTSKDRLVERWGHTNSSRSSSSMVIVCSVSLSVLRLYILSHPSYAVSSELRNTPFEWCARCRFILTCFDGTCSSEIILWCNIPTKFPW